MIKIKDYYDYKLCFVDCLDDWNTYKLYFTDNIEKVYADMYNSNVWLDDALTVTGHIEKFYSILPRVEIDLNYLNVVYNKKQYENITNRKDFPEGKQLFYL